MKTEIYGVVIEYTTQEELSKKIKEIRATKVPKYLTERKAMSLGRKVEEVVVAESATITPVELETVETNVVESSTSTPDPESVVDTTETPKVLETTEGATDTASETSSETTEIKEVVDNKKDGKNKKK